MLVADGGEEELEETLLGPLAGAGNDRGEGESLSALCNSALLPGTKSMLIDKIEKAIT